MVFKNATTATNQKLGLISAQQHSYINKKYGRQVYNNTDTARSRYSRPKPFDIWLNQGISFYESKGFKFQWIDLTTIKVTLPNGKTGTRTLADFEDEWKQDYCSQFPSYN